MACTVMAYIDMAHQNRLDTTHSDGARHDPSVFRHTRAASCVRLRVCAHVRTHVCTRLASGTLRRRELGTGPRSTDGDVDDEVELVRAVERRHLLVAVPATPTAYIIMAYIVMDGILGAYILTAYILMAYILMAYIVMTFLAMAYILMDVVWSSYLGPRRPI